VYGNTCVQVAASDSFSKQRCRYPIWMSADEIRSPSTSSTMRTVPCMAGCEGPMFSGMGSVGRSGAIISSVS